MKIVKSFYFNNSPDTSVIFIYEIIGIIFGMYKYSNGLVIFTIASTLALITGYMLCNSILNKEYYYLRCNRSFIRPKCIWINQCVKKQRDINRCPQKEFVREMNSIVEMLPEGITCYCCTHELIMNHIVKIFPDAECTEVYEKDLKKLKRKLRTSKCKNCKSKKCTLNKRDMTKFYAIKFVR